MSTNSIIAAKTNEGYKAIYCHSDGYPSYMYPMLRDYYGSQEMAEALVSLGDASFIDKQLTPPKNSNHSFDNRVDGVSVFYHRDRGESWEYNAPAIYPKDEVLNMQYYVYIFEDGCWNVYISRNKVDEDVLEAGDIN